MVHAPILLSFSPGPLGIELEPVWQAGEKSVGCRVAGFKRSGDGAVGQAERLGQVGEGDILTEVNDIPVSGMLFDKVIVCGDECHNMIIDMLRRDANQVNRRLSFRPSATPTSVKDPMLPPPQAQSAPERNTEKHTVDNLDTPSMTLSPETRPPPALQVEPGATTAEEPRFDHKEHVGSGSVRWAIGLLGMGRRGQFDAMMGVGNESANRQEGDGDVGMIVGGDESADARALRGVVIGKDGVECSNVHGDLDGVVGEHGNPDDRKLQRLLLPVGGVLAEAAAIEDESLNGAIEESICSNGSSHDTETGTGRSTGRVADGRTGRKDSVTERPLSGESADTSDRRVHHNSVGVRAGFPANMHLSSGIDSKAGFDSGTILRRSQVSSSAAGPGSLSEGRIIRGDTIEPLTPVLESTDRHAPNSGSNNEHVPNLSQIVIAADVEVSTVGPASFRAKGVPATDEHREHRPKNSRSGTPGFAVAAVAAPCEENGVVGMVIPPPAAAHERHQSDQEEGVNAHSPLGAPGRATDQSLDTVSLHSEPVGFANKNGSAGKSPWINLSHFWEGAAGVAAGGRSSLDFSLSGTDAGDGEGEGVRRLARSLAAKLKERAWRCEELEDLCGLRDDQVAMLQRQSNALAGRVAALSEQLLDQNALADALQNERSRLEQELAQQAQRHHSRPVSLGGSGSGGSPIAIHMASAKTGEKSDCKSVSRASADVGVDNVNTATVMGDINGELERPAAAAAAAAAEARADAAVAKAEARASALGEMVDSMVSEKVKWEEERAAYAAKALRLRARNRGLENALANSAGGATGGEDESDADGWRKGRGQGQSAALRELLRLRTGELEAKHGTVERLAACVRELQHETRQLNVSLSAREGDVLASDREMEALSKRMKGELLEKEVAVVKAEAEAKELRQALQVATANPSDESKSGVDGASTADGNYARLVVEKVQWTEERARLQHNLLSLQKLLEQREARAATEESAVASLLEKTRNDRDRFKNETVSLQHSAESLRVELAHALSSLAETHRGIVGKPGEENPDGKIEAIVIDLPDDGTEEVEIRGKEIDPLNWTGSEGGKGNRVEYGERDTDYPEDGVSREDAVSVAVGDEVPVEGDKSSGSGDTSGVSGREGGQTAAGRRDGDVGDWEGVLPSAAASGAGMQGSGLWVSGGFEGSVDELQLDLVEKDILIGQLRTQLKQLRARISEMEDDAAVDTAPLEGLLTQLGEFKGTVQEREEREQQCRDKVDRGLMRMERLKEENAFAAAAAVVSPSMSFGGSLGGVASARSRQAPDLASYKYQVEQQSLCRQIEDLQWELQNLKRRLEERERQLQEARTDADSLKTRSRGAERTLTAVRGEAEVAATEMAAEQRRAGVYRAEVQVLRAELRAARESAAKEGGDHRAVLETEVRGREEAKAAVAAVEAAARDREATLTVALEKSIEELERRRRRERQRRELSPNCRGMDKRSPEDTINIEEVQNRAKELESVKCSLAARDVELAAIADATAGFARQEVREPRGRGSGVGQVYGGGGPALRGALAAATDARCARRLVADLEEECSSLKDASTRARGDISRLRGELKVVKEEAVGAAETAAAAAASATSRNVALSSSASAVGEQMGKTRDRALAAEEALEKALTGAQQAWRLMTSCLITESGDDDIDADASISSTWYRQPRPAIWHPGVDPYLWELVAGAEALTSAHRRRGCSLRRAQVTVRAKTACAREARRREAREVRAREGAESRLRDAVAALDECEQHQDGGGSNEGRRHGGDESNGRFCGPSPGQQEHLRQIRREVDRLEGQNQHLRLSLVGDRLMRERSTSRGGGGRKAPPQRTFFPKLGSDTSADPGVGRWECRPGERLSGSEGAVSLGSRSPTRSWNAGAKARCGAGQWSPVEDVDFAGREGPQGAASDTGGDRGFVESHATGLYDRTPQDDGSGGTVVPGWHTGA